MKQVHKAITHLQWLLHEHEFKYNHGEPFFHIAKMFLDKIHEKCSKDDEYRVTFLKWFRRGGTIKLRDEILRPIGYESDSRASSTDGFQIRDHFNAFATIDSLHIRCNRNIIYKYAQKAVIPSN